jgi:ubiquitin-conjugating enzyme E2 Q
MSSEDIDKENIGNDEEEDFDIDDQEGSGSDLDGEIILGSDEGIILGDSFDPRVDPPPPVNPKEEEEREIEELTQRFNPQNSAARRLLRDLHEVMKSDPNELGFRTVPRGNNLFTWTVELFGFDEKSLFAAQLVQYKNLTGRDYVELQVTFPPDYPMHPPFVRVVQPRFKFHTGRVTIGGSLCTSLLTQEGWTPILSIQSVLINIFADIQAGDPEIDFKNNTPYSLEEAKHAFRRVSHDHGWKLPPGFD